MTCPDADWTLKLNTGEHSDALGMSYVQFAMDGLRHQMSQGAANWTVDPGDRFTFYKLVDSALPGAIDKDAHEKDFFSGIDTNLPALATRLGAEEKKVPQLRLELTELAKHVAEAMVGAKGNDASAAAALLTKTVAGLNHMRGQVRESTLTSAAKLDLLARLDEKGQQAETALNLALGLSLSADVVPDAGRGAQVPKEADALTAVSPGEEFRIATTLHNGSKQALTIDNIKLEVPPGWMSVNGKTRPVTLKAGDDLHVDFRLRVPKDAPYTRPYWHRANPETESVNHIDEEKYAELPFPPPALRARVEYSATSSNGVLARNGIEAVVVTPFINDAGKQTTRPPAVMPSFL